MPADSGETTLFLEGGKLPRKLIEGAVDYTVKEDRAVLTIHASDAERVYANMKRRGVKVVTRNQFTHRKACKVWFETSKARIAKLHREHVSRASEVTQKDRNEALSVYHTVLEEERRLVERHKRELQEFYKAQTLAVENLVRAYGRGPFQIGEDFFDPFQTRTGRLILKRRTRR